MSMQMLGRGMRRAEGKTDCLVIDVLGNQPDPRQQVVLPHVVGIEAASEDEGSVREPLRSRRSDPVLRSILGGRVETGLALLDPLGRSHCRWTAYSLTSTTGLVIWTTTAALLHEHGPLAPIWSPGTAPPGHAARAGGSPRRGVFETI